MRVSGFFLFLALLALPALALAETIRPGGGADTWTFYGYANGYVIARVLEAIIRITSSGSFVTLTMCIAIVGFLTSGAVGILGGNPTRIVSYIAGIVFTVYALFGLKVDVYVEDMLQANGVSQYSYLVKGVPAAIGLPAVAISEVGMWGIRAIETEFSSPAAGGQPPRLSGGALFGMSAGVLRDITDVRISDPKLRASIQNYIADCVIPAIHTGAIDSSKLVSGDVWEALEAAKHKVRLTDQPISSTGVLTCEAAYQSLNPLVSQIGQQLLKGVGNSAFAFQKAVGDTTLNNVVNFVSAGSTSNAAALAGQAAMIEVAQDGYRQAAIATESDALVLAINAEGARRAQKTGWFTASLLFQDMAGYFFAILQAFVIGLGPIIMAAMLVPNMGLKIAGGYAKVLVWLMLWWPGLAIVNYIMELYMQNQAGAALTVGNGITMANLGLVSTAAENMVIATGFMATMVPGIMWGLVSASGAAFSSVLDRASGGSYASQAASSAASGNVSMGNISMNNTAMNAHQMSRRFSTGNEAAQVGMGASAASTTQYLPGNNVDVAGNRQTIDRGRTLSIAQGQTAKTMEEAKTSYTSQLQSLTSNTMNEALQYAQKRGYMKEGSIDWSNATQDSQMQAYAHKMAALRKHADAHGISNEEFDKYHGGVQFYGDASVGGKLPIVGGVELGVKAQVGRESGFGHTTTDTTIKTKETTGSHDSTSGADSRDTHAVTQRGGERASDGEESSDISSHLSSEEFSRLDSAAKAWSEAKQYHEEISNQLSSSSSVNLSEGMNYVEYEQWSEQHSQRMRGIEERLAAARGGQDLPEAFNAAVAGARVDLPTNNGLPDSPNEVNERLAKQEENVGNDGDGVKKLQESIHRVDGQSTEAVNRHTAAGQDDAVSREAARTADSANREQLAARKKQIEAGIAAGKTFDADAMRELGLHDVKYGGETYTPHTFTKEPTADGSAEYRPVYRMEHESGDVSFHTFQVGHEGALMPMEVGRARYNQETGKYNLTSEHLAEGANAGQLTEAEMTAVLNGGKATDARDLAYQPNAGPMPQHHEHDRQPPRPEEKPVWTPPGQSDPGAGPSMNPSQQQDYLASQLRSTLERNRGAEAAAQFDQLTGEGGLSPSDAMGRIMGGKK